MNDLIGKPVHILLVEDNPGDVRLVKEAFRTGPAAHSMDVATDGVDAMAYLCGQGHYAHVPRPDIIIIDLNLPRKDGRELLAEIKQSRRFKCIPVIILTSSQAERDILKAYELNANCYVTKPVDFDQFVMTVQSIEKFWLQTATLPPDEFPSQSVP